MDSSVFDTPRSTGAKSSRWLTVIDAASVVGVTPATVRRWVAAGLLPARRLGPSRRILIDPADLERLMVPNGASADDEGAGR